MPSQTVVAYKLMSATRRASSGNKFSTHHVGVAFEEETAGFLEKLGWRTELTKASGDHGADIIARCGTEILVVQCKKWKGSVGSEAVRDVHFAKTYYSAHIACVIAEGSFSRGAKEAAETSGVHLLRQSNLNMRSILDRSVEGERLKREEEAKRRADEERRQAEAARRRINEAAREREQRELEARQKWAAYDEAKAKYDTAIARRGDRLAVILGFACAAALLLYWLSKHSVLGAGLLTLFAVVLALEPLRKCLTLKAPQHPSIPRSVGMRPPQREAPRFGQPRSATQSSPERFVVVECRRCRTGLRLRQGKEGTVECPSCNMRGWYCT
jgi:hypothetical protein